VVGVAHELEDYFDYRWWRARDVLESSESFYPRSLPRLLMGFLMGEQIDEPVELWS